MANTLLTPDQITLEAIRILHQNANFVANVNRQYDDQFANEGAKIGDTLRVRLPNEYVVRTGKTLSTQDTVETKVDLPVTQQHGVDITFDTSELTFDIDIFSERILRPAMTVLGANIESIFLRAAVKTVPVQITDAGSDITYDDILLGQAEKLKNLVPQDGRNTALLGPRSQSKLVSELKGLFQDSSEISQQYLTGAMGRTASHMFFANTHLPRFTSGTAATTSGYLVNGASQTGETLVVDTGTATFLEGDIITLTGVNRVHPETKEDTGELMTFVVTADSGASATSLSISPGIVTSGGKQNVTASPADNAAVSTILGASVAVDTDLLFHEDAFTLVTTDGIMPNGVDMASRQTFENIRMRFVRDFDITNDAFPGRFDVYWGHTTLRGNQAVRLQTN